MNDQTTDARETMPPQLIELPALEVKQPIGTPVLGDSLELVQDVKARLTVVAGEVELTVGELFGLKAEQVLKLESLVDAPLDILLEGKLLARGQLVAVDDHFGIRITELPRSGN